jgi:hypothetical protein
VDRRRWAEEVEEKRVLCINSEQVFKVGRHERKKREGRLNSQIQQWPLTNMARAT